jgi:hypothetical protein
VKRHDRPGKARDVGRRDDRLMADVDSVEGAERDRTRFRLERARMVCDVHGFTPADLTLGASPLAVTREGSPAATRSGFRLALRIRIVHTVMV